MTGPFIFLLAIKTYSFMKKGDDDYEENYIKYFINNICSR